MYSAVAVCNAGASATYFMPARCAALPASREPPAGRRQPPAQNRRSTCVRRDRRRSRPRPLRAALRRARPHTLTRFGLYFALLCPTKLYRNRAVTSSLVKRRSASIVKVYSSNTKFGCSSKTIDNLIEKV